MLIQFFYSLHAAGVPVSIREFLDLLGCMREELVFADREEFYYLARTVMVKDEKYFDKFDRAFSQYFEGLDEMGADGLDKVDIPDDWLKKVIERQYSREELEKLQQFGDFNELMEAFKQRLEEQKKRHQGGNRMIGTGGTSPFGAFGLNPAGFRTNGPGRTGQAVKVWEKRQYRNLDDSVQLGVRNIKMALRRLRKFTRDGMPEELDVADTISSTARNAGYLDIRMQPERRNGVKVLLFFDVGGSMDPYVRSCEELFSAAKAEFKHLEYFYFHNFIYEGVWRDNNRRWSERVDLWDVLHTYSRDYCVIFVGDAAMSPYEITEPGGSVEHWNEEPGKVWMQRLTSTFEKVIWLNPEPEAHWDYTQSVQWIRQMVDQHMYPLTIAGLEESMRFLAR